MAVNLTRTHLVNLSNLYRGNNVGEDIVGLQGKTIDQKISVLKDMIFDLARNLPDDQIENLDVQIINHRDFKNIDNPKLKAVIEKLRAIVHPHKAIGNQFMKNVYSSYFPLNKMTAAWAITGAAAAMGLASQESDKELNAFIGLLIGFGLVVVLNLIDAIKTNKMSE